MTASALDRTRKEEIRNTGRYKTTFQLCSADKSNTSWPTVWKQDGSVKWALEKRPQNLGRSFTVLCLSLLTLLEELRNGLKLDEGPVSVLKSSGSAAEAKPFPPSFSMGSDTLQDAWFSDNSAEVDIYWVLEFFLMAFNVLRRVERWSAIIKVPEYDLAGHSKL